MIGCVMIMAAMVLAQFKPGKNLEASAVDPAQ
jgi:hypothetical protein